MDGEISVEELQELLDVDGEESDADDDGSDGGSDPVPDDHLRIVDIRNPGAYERGHIPGSENIPASELTDRIEELDGAERVITVCPVGQSSVQAARLVGSYEGVDGRVESLHGGLDAWDGPLDASGPAEESGDGTTAPF